MYSVVLLIYIGIVAALVYLNYVIAKKFEKIAFEKGHPKETHVFRMCFWLGLVGYLYVIALPNVNHDTKMLNQQKRMIELLKNLDDKKTEGNLSNQADVEAKSF